MLNSLKKINQERIVLNDYNENYLKTLRKYGKLQENNPANGMKTRTTINLSTRNQQNGCVLEENNIM